MNKIFLLLLLVACGVQAQIGGSPTGFNYGIKLPHATNEGDTLTVDTKIPIFNDDNVLNYYADLGDLGDLVGVPRDSLIVQDTNSFGTLYTYWIGTEAQMDALILIDPNYFDNVLWFCTDCTEVVEVNWGNILGTLSDQLDLQAAFDLKLNSSAYTAADVLSKLLTVDGSGSGLDADLLRGVHWGNVNTAIISNSDISGRDGFFTRDGTAVVEIGGLEALGGFIGTDTDDDLLLRRNNSNKIRLTTGGIEVTGTASGSDPVNNDDFVTKGYAETNFATVESGTFTPTLVDLGGGATYSGSKTGHYTKFGGWVNGEIVMSSIGTTGTPTGGLFIGNFPFTIDGQIVGTIGRFSGSSTSFYSVYAWGNSAVDGLLFYMQKALDGNLGSPAEEDITFTSGDIYLNFTYRTNE